MATFAHNKYPRTGPNYQKWGEQPGLIYDPWADAYRPDPKAQQEYYQSQGFIEDAPEQPGIWEQSAAATLPTLTTIGAMKGMETLFSDGAEAVKYVPELGGVLMSDGTIKAVSTAATAAQPAAAASGLLGAGSSAIETPTLLSATRVAPPGGGMLSLGGIGSAGNVILPAAGAVGAANLLTSDIDNDRKGWIRGLGQGAASGAAMGSYFGAPGAAIGAGVGGLLGLAKLALRHKSTKDYQDERWGALSSAAQGLMAANHPEGDDGIWDTGKYAGEKWTFEKAQDLAKDDPVHFIGVLGNVEAYGDEWLGLSEDKQREIVARNVAAGNYWSDKGDVLIKDRDLAQQIKQDVLGQEEENDDQND